MTINVLKEDLAHANCTIGQSKDETQQCNGLAIVAELGVGLVGSAEHSLVAIPDNGRVLAVVPNVPQPIPTNLAIAVEDRDVTTDMIGVMHGV